ncbi:MAG: diacylglycerol/polyprenol kinase family protein [Candidatus Firestonebacteria bacterium]
MPWDFKKEIIRKSIHLLSILFLSIYVFFAEAVNHKVALLILSFVLIILLELEYARIELGAKIPLIKKLWEYRREKEKENLGGEIYFLIGAIICLAIFDKRIATAAILMTTFGDMAAAIIGTKFGKTWIPFLKNRAVEGVIAEFTVNLIIGFLVLRNYINERMWWATSLIPNGEPLWLIIIVMALTATIVETVVHKLDDNLLVPVFAGFNGEIVFLIMMW